MQELLGNLVRTHEKSQRVRQLPTPELARLYQAASANHDPHAASPGEKEG